MVFIPSFMKLSVGSVVIGRQIDMMITAVCVYKIRKTD